MTNRLFEAGKYVDVVLCCAALYVYIIYVYVCVCLQ